MSARYLAILFSVSIISFTFYVPKIEYDGQKRNQILQGLRIYEKYIIYI